MIEITNRTTGPIPIMIRSTKKTRGFATLIIPGKGAGNNIKVIEDELYTEYIERAENKKLISTRRFTKGERDNGIT